MKTEGSKIKNFFYQNRLIFAAFFLPVLLVVFGLAVNGIYPFGGNQIAVIDMYHQYVPFLSELQYKLQEDGSLFYTWDGAGGSNFWNLLSYYGASPLNLILVLFPQRFIMEGVTVVLLIKIGLAGSFMAMYLRYQGKSCNWSTVAFAVLYALCSFVMAYYWCVMWIDVVALLPLCLLGLNRLIDDGRAVMYTVSLALIVFINYYMAIMVCIFIFFYYFVLYFTKKKGNGFKKCAATTGKAIGFSAIAVGMAAVMLIPTYLSMQNTYYISSDFPDTTSIYYDALDIINQLLPYSELTYREGLPNLYCGMLVVILLVFYIINKKISLREKILNGCFLIFIFFSINVNVLNFIWHGMHFPNQLPYRYTFAVSVVLIAMAYHAFRKIDSISVRTVGIVLASGIGYYLIAQKILTEHIEDMNLFFYGGIAWLVCYCIILILYKKDMINRKVLIALVTIVVSAEMAAGAAISFGTVGNTDRSSYFENYDDITTLAEESKKDFARTEIDYEYVLNGPALYHYNGLSQFSSSINADTGALMEKIGLEGTPGKNRYNYNQTVPVLNAMLNVKYMITKNTELNDEDFSLVDTSGDSQLYESDYPLSIGYMTGRGIIGWNTDSDNPFEVLESYVEAATSDQCSGVFSSVDMSDVYSDNASTSLAEDGTIDVLKDSEGNEASVDLEYKSDKTQKYYVFVEADNADSIVVDKGSDMDNVDIRNDSGSIVNIGEIDKGDSFDIEVSYTEENDTGRITCHVCTLNYDVWDRAYDILSRNTMTVTDSSDTEIKGTVDAGSGGMLVTSVMYEDGWTLKVDGEEREINELVGGAFVAVELDSGIHEIELKFRPPGLMTGLIVSCIAILLLVVFTLLRRRRVRREELFNNIFPNIFPKEQIGDNVQPSDDDQLFDRQEAISSSNTDEMSDKGI